MSEKQRPLVEETRPDWQALAAYLAASGLPDVALAARQAPARERELVSLQEALLKAAERLPVSPRPADMQPLIWLLLGRSTDVIFRPLQVGPAPTDALLVIIRNQCDQQALQIALDHLLTPPGPGAPSEPEAVPGWLVRHFTTIPGCWLEQTVGEMINALLDGEAALFVAGASQAIRFLAPTQRRRVPSEPETERVIRGPREGFTEQVITNLGLVRARLRSPRLAVESLEVGEVSRTTVMILHMYGICRPELVAEARRRLTAIRPDGVTDSAQVEELIEDTPWSVFPLVRSTERPDAVAGALLEGRVAILVDSTPFALIAPTFFVEMMHSPEDYYERFPMVFLLRTIRWVLGLIALTGPAFYVAVTNFHPQMLPTQLLLTVMAAREGVPFPGLIEAILMELALEALREAAIRLPKAIGQSVSIVGALIIGQAAVQAGVVSPIMVVVVALTGIASFVIPRFSTAIGLRLLRFPLLLLTGTLGLLGLTLGFVAILTHLLSLRSFGAPFLAPLGPLIPGDLRDAVVRAPFWALRRRPAAVKPEHARRAGR